MSEGEAFTDTETNMCHRSECVCVCVCVCVWPRIEHSAKHSALSVRNVLLFCYIFYFYIKKILLYVACVCECLFCLLDANSNNYLQVKEYMTSEYILLETALL